MLFNSPACTHGNLIVLAYVSVADVNDVHKRYVDVISQQTKNGHHAVSRSNIFSDVLQLHAAEDACLEYPFEVKFVDEAGLDFGGVTRDMYSAFWAVAYTLMFDRSNILIPVITAGMDRSSFTKLGRVIVHGFLTSQILPIRIAFPVLACTLLSPSIKIPDDILISTFVDSLIPYESDILKRALSDLADESTKEFSEKSALINLVSRFGARKLPTKDNLKTMIKELAEFMFVVQPLPMCHLMHQGIPTCHQNFWSMLTIEELYSIYQSMAVTARKIIESIIPPSSYNSPNEERIFGYLLQCIGNLHTDERAKFLRFVTGSSVFSDRAIFVAFNP